MNYANSQSAQAAVSAYAKVFDPIFLEQLNNATGEALEVLQEEYEHRANTSVGAALFFAQIASGNEIVFTSEDFDAARSDFDILLESGM